MKKQLRVVVYVVVYMMLCLTARTGTAEETIVIAGTGDSQRLLRYLADVFTKEHPGVIIDVPESVGSSGGIKALIKGTATFARTAWPPTVYDDDLTSRVFAYSPIVFVVNRSVTGVDDLTADELTGILSGRIACWDEVGGGDEKIYVVQREEGDSARRALENGLPGWKDIPGLTGETAFTTSEAVEKVAAHKNTIGYVPLDTANDERLKVIAVNGVSPSQENVARGKYRLLVPLALVWKGEPSSGAKAFVDFLFGRKAGEIISSRGLLPAGR